MLQKIREKITGWVAGIILALLAFVFAVWGIDIGFNAQSYAAVVNGEEIPVAPVRRAIQNQMSQFQQAYGPELPPGLEQQVRAEVIEGFIRTRLLVERVREQGYRISNQTLTDSIRQMQVFQVGGSFSMDAYRAMLANAGYSPAGFEAEQRQTLEVAQLQDGIFNSAFVTPQELARRAALEREQREVGWLVLPIDSYLAGTQVSDDDIEAEYEENGDRYMTPESVDVEYIEINLEQIAADVAVSEEEIRSFYDAELGGNPELFVTPEQRRARHILINVDDDTGDEAALERIEALRARIEGGEDFATVARAESEDSGSAAQGGDLDWVERGMMVAPFEEALFELQPGDVSQPVKSPFGYHLILLEELRAGDTKTFDDMRDELAAELRTRKAEDLFYAEAETLETLSFEHPDTLSFAAEALGRPIQRIERMGRGGGSGIAASPLVRDAAFSEAVLLNRENSVPLELEEGQAVVLRVVEHHQPAKKPLAEVRDRIESLLRRDQARERLSTEGESIRARIAGGGIAEDIATGAGAVYEPPRLIGRDASGVPEGVQNAAFSTVIEGDGPAVSSAELPDGSYAVVIVRRIVPGSVDQLPMSERQAFAARVEGQQGNAELAAYVRQLRSDARVIISTEQFE